MHVSSYTLLHTASRNIKQDEVNISLGKGTSIEAKAGNGYTPLHFAAEVHVPAVDRISMENRTGIGRQPTKNWVD